MKLQDLFVGIPDLQLKAPGGWETEEALELCFDSRQVQKGSVFVAVRGAKADGHAYLEAAVRQGAVALVVEDERRVPADFKGVVAVCPHSRVALDALAVRWSSDPTAKLFCVGVTGTNGKTSTTYLIESILNSASMSCGVIGTVDHHLGEKTWPSEMTTPDPVFLQKRLREFVEAGAKAVAMEVSSHALDQSRADSVQFDVAVFTNLTRDHLDYHATMEDYFAAKQKLFLEVLHASPKTTLRAIVNIGDEWGRRLRLSDRASLWTYGSDEADFRFEILASEFTGTVFRLDCPYGTVDVSFPMPGLHNVQNAVAALAVGLAAGLDLEQAVSALEKFRGVPGRLQSVTPASDLHVFVDYAHSPDALENVLKTLRQIRDGMGSPAKIWTVFGCGGDRDKGKRPEMAKVAESFSERIVITSDNPRTEDPFLILKEIQSGLSAEDKATLIEDRERAIRHAIEHADPGDVILIAGKGHEDYQILGTEKRPFSDLEVAARILGERRER